MADDDVERTIDRMKAQHEHIQARPDMFRSEPIELAVRREPIELVVRREPIELVVTEAELRNNTTEALLTLIGDRLYDAKRRINEADR